MKYFLILIFFLPNFVVADCSYGIQIKTNGKYKEEYHYDYGTNRVVYINNITNIPKLLGTTSFEDEDKDENNVESNKIPLDKTKLESEFEFRCIPDKSEKKSKNVEFLQHRTTKDYFFKVLLSIKGSATKMVGINVYRKRDGSLLQTIDDFDGYEFMSIDTIKQGYHLYNDYFFGSKEDDQSINTDDYNFDGDNNEFYISQTTDDVVDIPIIDRYYAFNKKKGKFIYLNLEGRYITFDENKKQAIRRKICSIKDNGAVIVTETHQYDVNKNHFTLINSLCQYKKFSDQANDEFSRQCTQKEENYCNNESELDKDELEL
ncbi:hypothetical protein [Gilliamella intestini]|uniref:DKNYY family protein n=1 Tax=Gilliamella intestini TaxID=1798183 RepID=A0A1C3ZJR0_9GAMM|nr:hypothetical protein [Gilliamella intestini]SCB82558.1 hypothetical protein GA0061080_100528 [Gilliamella intestini]